MARFLKRRDSREALIGGLAVVGLAGVLAWSYGADPRAATTNGDGLRLLADFNRVDGLVEGDPVYVSGVRVGTVADLSLNDAFRVTATFHLDDPVALPEDTAAVIHTDGLFGSKFVVLDPGGAERMLESGDRIRYTQDAVIISRLLDLIISEGQAARRSAQAEDRGPKD